MHKCKFIDTKLFNP